MFAALNSFLTRAVSGYFLNKSLRFRSSASAYLNRTAATATNQKTFTWSAWVKLGNVGTGTRAFFNANPNSSTDGFNIYIGLNSDNDIGVSQLVSASNVIRCATNAVYRDPAAWYHVVVVVDTTQATNSNGVVIYVNGAIQTLTFNAYTQNANTYVNSAISHQLGRSTSASGGSGAYYDGEMAEVNFVDGRAVPIAELGAYSTYNQWLPIRYAGTYGTNGFYLPFSGGTTTSYAGSFNGSNQYLNVNSVTAVGTGDFTVEAFVYFNALGDAALFQLDTAGLITNWSLSLDATANKFRFFVRNDAATTNADILSSAAAVTNQWYHVAGVVSGTTATLYVNGISVASATLSGVRTGTGTTIFMGQNGASGGRFLNGYMSNNRYVKGTAVYTANFIPPTANLTNITNTVLLTLQNATIVDNSSNGYTVVNNNTVVTSVQSPFLNSTVLVADSSGNANNWTPNNISLTAGSTYDSLTDVPTLTSTTVANYAVLNPLDSSSPTLATNGNLTWTNPATSHLGIRGSIAIPATGAFYIEAINVVANSANAWIGFGLAASTVSLTTNMAGTSANSFNFYSGGSASAYIYSGTSLLATLSAFSASDVVQIAVDVTNTKMWLGKNNVWYSSTGATTGNPTTGANPTFTTSMAGLFLMIEAGGPGGTAAVNMNFGQQPFTYTAPSGFLPLNTFNI